MYNDTDASKTQIGHISTYLGFSASYKAHFNEVRIGNQQIVRRKTAEAQEQMQIEQFGLQSHHSILLTGCTFNPTLQSSMKQSLGPMTIVINLCMTTEKSYQENWEKAFVQVFKLLSYAPQIAKMLAGSKTTYKTIIGQLADLALCGITRSSNKARIPFSMILTACSKVKAYIEHFKSETFPNTKIIDAMLPDRVKHLDLSGHGLFYFWNSIAAYKFHINRTSAMTERIAREVVLHAVFGTHR